MPTETLGQILYTKRTLACKTQKEYAKDIGIGRSTYIKLEADQMPRIKISTIQKLALYLGKTTTYIVVRLPKASK